jgi:hypothetical protein
MRIAPQAHLYCLRDINLFIHIFITVIQIQGLINISCRNSGVPGSQVPSIPPKHQNNLPDFFPITYTPYMETHHTLPSNISGVQKEELFTPGLGQSAKRTSNYHA